MNEFWRAVGALLFIVAMGLVAWLVALALKALVLGAL